MTSGKFKSFPVDKIWVDREKRQRRDLEGIEELAESIGRVGLIHPPVIRKSGELVVGERRLNALQALGWTHTPVQFIEDLPEAELREVELEENLRRRDVTWQDQCNAVQEYHKLRQAKTPDWNNIKTAESLGMSVQEVGQRLIVARELAQGNARVVAAPRYSTARGIVQRETERKLQSVVPSKQELEVPLICADFHEWVKTYEGEPFNLIHCDFPYGVNADKHDQGAASAFGGYKDTEADYQALLGSLWTAMSRSIVAESAHLIFWFSMDYYEATKNRLQEMHWIVNLFPLIWFKSDNTGILPDPARGPRRVYETAFLASRGDRPIIQAKSNLFASPVNKTVHMSEKPRPMLRHFMEMLCDEYSSVLDPTAGSGNALRVATDLRAGRVLGLERDPALHAAAVDAWKRNAQSNTDDAESGDGTNR